MLSPAVGEPQRPVRPGRDRGRAVDVGVVVVWCTFPAVVIRPIEPAVAVAVGEPQRPVRARRDPLRDVDAGAGVVGDLPRGGDPPDPAVVAVTDAGVGEPQRPVRAGRDPRREVDAAAAGVVGDLPEGGDPPDRAGAGRRPGW